MSNAIKPAEVRVRRSPIADAVHSELETIRKKHGGMLDPNDVVSFARNPRTALHSQFCWDDTEAARQWRLEQARTIIAVMVTVIQRNGDGPIRVRAYVSLPDDRGEGGYRATTEVLSKKYLRDQMLASAFTEMEVFRRKYAALKELSVVFAAMEVATKLR